MTWVETEDRATTDDPAAAAVARLSAAPVLPLGDLGDAVRQGAAREADRPAALPRQEGALAQLRGRLRRRRARAAEPHAPHLRAAGVLRAGRAARGLRAADARDPAPAPGQRAQHLDPPCDARHRDDARLGAARDLRLRPLSQAAHAGEREEPGRRLDPRADRRRARGRRHLLPAVPAACDRRAVPPRLSAGARVLRAEVGGRSELPLHQRALGQVLPRLARPHPARGRGRASERVPPGVRRRRPLRRLLSLPADGLPHRPGRPLPPPDQATPASAIATRRRSTATCSRS